MNKEEAKKFWDDFIIPTQEIDHTVSFVNPSDIARCLIKARNWSGVLTQDLIDLRQKNTNFETSKRFYSDALRKLERQVLSHVILTSAATKNRETQRAFLYTSAFDEEKNKIDTLETTLAKIEDDMSICRDEMNDIERMLKLLANSTEWLTQYLNWYKYEMRTLE